MTIVAPSELAARPQWVAWRLTPRPGEPKPTKVPYDARTGRLASTTDPNTWASFEEAAAFCTREHCSGVGYVLAADDPYVGVDLDGCRDPGSGQIKPWAKAIMRRLHSYTEISPSGTGVRIFVRAELPSYGRRKGPIEIYSQARFLTITGDHVIGYPETIQECSDEVLRWHAEVFGPPPEQRSQNGHVQRSPVQLADADLLLKARSAENGPRFWALWNGDYSSYGSQSEADLALLSHLSFWTGPEPARLDQLFRSSGLMREKWDRQDYRERTIGKALEGKTEFYGGVSTSPRLQVSAATPTTVDPVTGEVVKPELRFKFLTAEEVKNRPSPTYIIPGVLQCNTIAMIVGAQETYKSFVGLGMAMSVSEGIDWAGRAVQRACVAYVSAEGGSGLKQRITAWEMHNETPITRCYFLPDQAPQFLDRGQAGDVEELIRSLRALPVSPELLFVDTLARTMVGGDENSAQDMGLYIASAEQIRQETGVTVVLIHHNNRQGSARGSSALLGAVHTIIECSRERNSEHVVVRCGKQKDAEHFDTMTFTSRAITIDDEGRSSLVVELNKRYQLTVEPTELNVASVTALEALRYLGTATFAQWRDQTTLPNTTFRRVRSQLVRDGLVDHSADRYTLTDVGQTFEAKWGQSGASGPGGPGAELRGQKGPYVVKGPLAPSGLRGQPSDFDEDGANGPLPW